ncbi:MAG: hypothetical protein HFJ02_03910 [Bacilli bacterium]|nr:hypothetical protein [Bacilli bacterium]
MNDLKEIIINNEYDYSNSVPTVEFITYIVQYCDQIYNHFLNLIEQDEKKNERLKYEFQNYNYKKSYREEFVIKIRQKNYNTISCKNYDSFIEAVKNGQVSNIESLEIHLVLDYKRGKIDNLNSYENDFNITFKPYQISFIRKANHQEIEMNQIENNLNEILKKFPVTNTIFCSK